MTVALISAAGVSGLLAILADRGDRRPGVFYILKPLTTMLILSSAAAADPIDVTYQQWILLALVLSLVGDVALMFKGDRWFLGGLCSFLLAHLAFIAAFLSGLQLPEPPIWSYAVLLWGFAMFSVLWSRVGRLKIPVLIYGLILALMVMAAAARNAAMADKASFLILCGALFFMASDSLLGYRRFVRPCPDAQPLILSTYWIGIGLIAWSI
jgi:uncharacterized membrane protein YhhN